MSTGLKKTCRANAAQVLNLNWAVVDEDAKHWALRQFEMNQKKVILFLLFLKNNSKSLTMAVILFLL